MSSVDYSYRRLFENRQGASKYRNAPVALQVVGRRLQEEKILNIAAAIERSVLSTSALVGRSTAVDEVKMAEHASTHSSGEATFSSLTAQVGDRIPVAA